MGSPSRSWRITHAAIFSGSSPGSTSSFVTSATSTATFLLSGSDSGPHPILEVSPVTRHLCPLAVALPAASVTLARHGPTFGFLSLRSALAMARSFLRLTSGTSMLLDDDRRRRLLSPASGFPPARGHAARLERAARACATTRLLLQQPLLRPCRRARTRLGVRGPPSPPPPPSPPSPGPARQERVRLAVRVDHVDGSPDPRSPCRSRSRSSRCRPRRRARRRRPARQAPRPCRCRRGR